MKPSAIYHYQHHHLGEKECRASYLSICVHVFAFVYLVLSFFSCMYPYFFYLPKNQQGFFPPVKVCVFVYLQVCRVCFRHCMCASVWVLLMMLFCQRREKAPVTIVMRGIYISYLALNHSDLLFSCLFLTRQVCAWAAFVCTNYPDLPAIWRCVLVRASKCA